MKVRRSNNTFIHSAENDAYHKCAVDALKKCVIESMHVFEHEQGDTDVVDDEDDAYIRCLEEQTKTCNHAIMRHFFEQTEAYKMEMEMLESEEQQG